MDYHCTKRTCPMGELLGEFKEFKKTTTDDVKEIKHDIKELLSFKSSILTMTSTKAAIISGGISFAGLVLSIIIALSGILKTK